MNLKSLFFTLAVSFCWQSIVVAAPSEFRGYVATNELLKQRLMEPGSQFELGAYLGETYDPSPYTSSLLDLMGTYKSLYPDGKFHNGAPNSTNVMLWHMALSGFATELGQQCLTPGSLKLEPVFQSTVDKLCQWPAAGAKDQQVLLSFWFSVMGYGVDVAEFEAWRDFILQEYSAATAADALRAMSYAALANPYFLLQ